MNSTDQRFYGILKRYAENQPEKNAVVEAGGACTYRELMINVDRIASWLINQGLNKGDHVGVWGTNTAMWLCSYFGIVRAGGIACLYNFNFTAEEVVPLLELTDTRFMFYGTNKESSSEGSTQELMAEKLGLSKEMIVDYRTYDFSDTALQTIDDSDWDVKADSHIIFTSGTTGLPKAVRLSQFSTIFAVNCLNQELGQGRGDRAMITVPLFHVYPLQAALTYILHGSTLHFVKKGTPDEIAEMVNEYDVKDLWSVTTVIQKLIDSEEIIQKLEPHLNLCCVAGGYTSPMQLLRFETVLDKAVFLNMYGMSETSGVYVYPRTTDSPEVRYNSLGRAANGVELEIMGDNGVLLPRKEVGEIVTRGCHTTNGYYKLPQEKQCVDAEGWLHSGDLGYLDEDGNLFIVGRIKDLIIKGGENIAPAGIEKELVAMDEIKNAKVFGVKDALYGENIAACVILQDGCVFDADRMNKEMKKKVGTFRMPKYYFVYESFPLAGTGKINQQGLRNDMLNRYIRQLWENRLHGGVILASLQIKNALFAIDPIVAMVKLYTRKLGFAEKRVKRIALAVEEMLYGRIMNMKDDLDDIWMNIMCYPETLKINFIDKGSKFIPEAKSDDVMDKAGRCLIMMAVDDLQVEEIEDGKTKYCLEFLYDKEFNIEDFLVESKLAPEE